MNKFRDLPLKYVKNYEYYGSLSNEDKDMLSSACIISDTLSDTVYSIDCVCFNKKRHGVGILNVNGGVEFINFNNMDTSTTLRAYGISVVPNKVHPTFRVIRQSCSAYSLSLKYRSSLKPYALRFITFILLFMPSTLPVEM